MRDAARLAIREGKARVDYSDGNSALTETFEEIGNSVLVTSFNSDGRVLDRRLSKGGKGAEARALEFAGSMGRVERCEYSEVLIGKACPKCGGRLEMHVGEADVPIMPLYDCRGCGSRSFDLTDEYLQKLVSGNRVLFENSELDALGKSPEGFRNELMDYIIKIYASKHISKIR